MSAVPVPQDDRPLYTTTYGSNFEEWLTENLYDLVAYYDSLSVTQYPHELDLFLTFAQKEYDCQQCVDEENEAEYDPRHEPSDEVIDEPR